MSLTDPIGDMLARIKNSQLRNHKKVEMPSSNFKMKIADVLKNEGYINGFNVDKNESIMFGDTIRDRDFAANCGIKFQLIK